MSVRVTADIFSGRPNPEWTLNESQIAQLANQLRDAFAAPPLRAHIPDGLGYRGLIVTSDDSRVPTYVRVHRNVVTRDDATFHPAADVETFLVRTAGDALPPGLVSA